MARGHAAVNALRMLVQPQELCCHKLVHGSVPLQAYTRGLYRKCLAANVQASTCPEHKQYSADVLQHAVHAYCPALY